MKEPSGKTRFLICNCENTMDLDASKLSAALGLGEDFRLFTNLCRTQIDDYQSALHSEHELCVGCTQESPLFREIALDEDRPVPGFANIRERAGWTKQKGDIHPKIAALLAASQVPHHPTGLMDVHSEGVCLVYGRGQLALDVAGELADRLSVSVILTQADDAIPPSSVDVPIYTGKIRAASGSIGNFEITVDGYAPMVPSSKETIEFLMTQDGAKSSCDLILDLTGEQPLFSDHKRRDGYFSIDPQQPLAIARTLFEISDMVGTFEKPIYVSYDPDICAHSRSQIIGCSNCIDNCPVSAIQSDGDVVKIDRLICGGCGNCSASCPTGAVSYDYPGRQELMLRIQTLLESYRRAGGVNPVLLIHDETEGSELIAAVSRFGSGLPVNVLPLSVYSPTQLGHEVLLAAFASGAASVRIQVPRSRIQEADALRSQVALANQLTESLGFEADFCSLIEEQEPDQFEEAVARPCGSPVHETVAYSTVGGKREIVRSILIALDKIAPAPQTIIPLDSGAPYGQIVIDTENCTLCLACIGACPANALSDNPENPQLRFTEQACVQCGLCRSTCPENVIRLQPRYNLQPSAMDSVVLNEEEPFHCTRCGKAFGTKATVEHILSVLEKKHSMFQSEEQISVIKMCDDCRVITLAESSDDPFKQGERPRIRTTDDYIEEERKSKTNKTPDDFIC